jgi:hypothetical protein
MGTFALLAVMKVQFLMSDEAIGYFVMPAMFAAPLGLILYFCGRYQRRP